MFFPPLHKIHGFTNNWRNPSLSWDVMNLSNYPTFFGKFFQLGNRSGGFFEGGVFGWSHLLREPKRVVFWKLSGNSPAFFSAMTSVPRVSSLEYTKFGNTVPWVFSTVWMMRKKSELGGGNSDIYDHFFSLNPDSWGLMIQFDSFFSTVGW